MPRSILVGAEATDLTTATAWRLLQYESCDVKAKDGADLSYRGIGAGGGAPSLSAFRRAGDGASGSLSVAAYSNGLGLFNKAAGSTFASAVADGGTLAYEQITEFDAVSAPANRSISMVKKTDQADGDIDDYLYTGGLVTDIEIMIEIDKLVMIKYGLDFRTATVPGSAPSGSTSPTIVSPDLLFAWSDVTATLTNLATDATSTDKLKSIKITLPLSLDVADKSINNNGVRLRPTRAGLPSPTIELGWKYQDPKFSNAYRASVPHGISIVATGSTPIEDTTVPSFTIDVPAFVYDPNDPEMSVDDPTTQTMPARVMWNDEDPIATFTQITSDTAA